MNKLLNFYKNVLNSARRLWLANTNVQDHAVVASMDEFTKRVKKIAVERLCVVIGIHIKLKLNPFIDKLTSFIHLVAK